MVKCYFCSEKDAMIQLLGEWSCGDCVIKFQEKKKQMIKEAIKNDKS